MAKGGNEDDLKQLGSDASQALGPIMKQAEKAFKTSGMLVKSPNPKMAEALADQIEDIVSDSNELKKLLKDLKAASK